MSTPEQVPAELFAGDTWSWTRELADYPATTYTAAWYFENKDATFSVAAGASGSVFTGSVAAGTTATRRPGRYRWRLLVTKISDSSRVVAEEGWLDLHADPAAAGTRDWRSHNRRTLEAIEATIEGRATSDQAAMSIAGRSLSRTPMPDLVALHDRYLRRVAAEDRAANAAAGKATGSRIVTRMA